MNIIQHHEPIDLPALFQQAENEILSIDQNDLDNFADGYDNIHSFHGISEGKERTKNALLSAIASEDAAEIISKGKAFMLFVKYSPDCEYPFTMGEMSAIQDFVAGLPEGVDIQWCTVRDSALGDKVEVLLLCNTKE